MTESKTKKSKNEKLQETLFSDKKSSWLSKEIKKDTVYGFAKDYMDFMTVSKTERLCVDNIVKSLSKKGFKDMTKVKSAKTGDKLYKVYKNKVVLAFVVGKNSDKFNIVGSHVDSPRLDLKPSPLYEDSDLALLKTHYYGGLKKYHWVNTPLVLKGVVFTRSGKKVEINIGEKKDDPVFIIPDLLIHLARDQMDKKASKVVEGEELNILIGNMPVDDDKIKEKFKFNVLKRLNDDHGIVEEDFNFAELELVPANNPVEIGLDRSMIGAYGHDDKVCVYTSLRALLDVKNPKNTALAMFFDKEEIGSFGDTGASSYILRNFAQDYSALVKLKASIERLLESSEALSADVTAGMNPNYKNVQDATNVSFLGRGVSIEKYGGGGGKYSTHDAHAEYMSRVRRLLEKDKISWQTGELGKIDVGGGGTIGMFLSRYGMDCLDAGPCVLGMHSPFEVVSKADIYSAYRLYLSFFKD